MLPTIFQQWMLLSVQLVGTTEQAEEITKTKTIEAIIENDILFFILHFGSLHMFCWPILNGCRALPEICCLMFWYSKHFSVHRECRFLIAMRYLESSVTKKICVRKSMCENFFFFHRYDFETFGKCSDRPGYFLFFYS